MDDKKSDHRHYQVRESGSFTLIVKHDEQPAKYDIGIVERGPCRVFAGYFVKIEILGGERLVGVDANSMVLALCRLQRSIFSRGMRMDCVALSGEWTESGLSENSAWGYYGPSKRLLHMMAAMPEGTTGPTLDHMIKRVVSQMFSRASQASTSAASLGL